MGARNDELLARYQRSVMGVFGLPPLVLSHGSGCHVWDVDGNRYLDLVGGIAVNALGHGHPALVAAISKQAGEAIHVSNLFTSEGQITLAERLVELAGAPEGSARLLRQLGRRGDRGRHQAEPPHRPLRHRRRRGGLPRAHHRRARADPQAGLPRAVRAAHPRCQPRPLRRRGRAARGRHDRDGRGRPRARAGRGGGARARGPAYLRLARELTTRARRPARSWTRSRPASAAPARGSPSSRPGSCPTPSPSPRDSAEACRSARSSPSVPRSPGCSPPGSTARPSAATRWRRPPRWPSSRRSRTQGLLAHAAAAGQHLVDVRSGTWPSARHRGAGRRSAARHRADRAGRRPGGGPGARGGLHRQPRCAARDPPRAAARRHAPTSSTPSSTPCPPCSTQPAHHPRTPHEHPPLPARRRPDRRRAGPRPPARPRAQGRARSRAARSRARGPWPSSSTSRPCAPRCPSRARSPGSAATRSSSTATSPRSGPASRSPTRPASSGRSPPRSCGGPTARTGSRRWPRTPASPSSTRSPTTSTRARSSPTCSRARAQGRARRAHPRLRRRRRQQHGALLPARGAPWPACTSASAPRPSHQPRADILARAARARRRAGRLGRW